MRLRHLYRAVCAVLAVLIMSSFSGCAAEQEMSEPTGKVYFEFFDTVSYVYNYCGDSAERFDQRSADVSAILSDYHKLFDIYHEYSGINNLCTVNKNAGGEAVKVDPKLIEFLEYCEEMYQLTNGEVNVMMGSVLKLWHNCREQAQNNPEQAHLPLEEELAEAAEHTDISSLEVDREACTIRISDPDASIDVGAIGKGYATEMAAQELIAQGASGYVLNIGGNIRTIGVKPDGSSWVTGIRNPDPKSEDFISKITLEDTSCVTSGVYERYYVVDNVRYHHIIDKDTLYPANYYTSLTVVTEHSGMADALSTALFCLPPEESRALAESLDGVDIIWVYADGTVECTTGAEARFVTIPDQLKK